MHPDVRFTAGSTALCLLSLCALATTPAVAQSTPAQQQAGAMPSADTPAQGPVGAAPTNDPNAAAADQPKISTSDSVTVTAPGEVRDEQSVSSKLLLEAAPGTSPIEVLGRLPSVVVTTADPYGAYEWATRISVRGFNQNQLGFTLDEVPLGDMSYGNLNGLHISRAIIDENMGHVTLSQGTGSLETASTSNLGGSIQFFSSDPLDQRRGNIQQSFGSFNAYRTFGRFDSGLLGGKTKFFVSGVYQRADKWKSVGEINQHYYQINGKVTSLVGKSGLFSAYVDYSNRAEVDYQDLTKIWVNKLGYKFDNYGNWAEGIQAANACNGAGSFPYPVSTLNPATDDPCDAAYYGSGGLRKDFLSYASYKTALGTHFTLKGTAYGHGNNGRGLWFTPYNPTYNSNNQVVSPIALRTSEYGIARGGFLTSLAWQQNRNLLEGGFWLEKESFDLARKFYATSLDSPMHSLYDFPTNPFYTQWSYNFPSTIAQFHLQDLFQLTPRVTLSAGFKSVETYQTGNLGTFNVGYGASSTATAAKYAQGKLESGSGFLPQIGADFKLNTKSEVFADVAKNTRAFQTGGPGFGTSPWGTSQVGFNALTNNLKPESSWSEEVGYRFTSNLVSAQGNFFHVNFSNRLLAIQQGPGIAGNASLLSNVGGVTTNGVDGAASIRVHEGWILYNAVTFSRSTHDSNYSSNGVVIPTGGKIVVDAPEFLYKDGLAYNKSNFETHIDADFLSKRYFTYTDDNSVDGRFLANFGASYHRDEIGPFDQLKLQFNLYNLAGARYYSTIGTNGFVASDPTSINNQTLQVGAPRTFTGTFSARF